MIPGVAERLRLGIYRVSIDPAESRSSHRRTPAI
jgi:hypothetical protein